MDVEPRTRVIPPSAAPQVRGKEAADAYSDKRAHPRTTAGDRVTGSTVRLAHRAADLPPQERSNAGPAPPPALTPSSTKKRSHRAGPRWLLRFPAQSDP